MMNKVLSFMLFLAALALTSCENEFDDIVITDWVPVSIELKVNDTMGNDLLNPENPDNVIDGTTISFKGKIYEATRERVDGGKWHNAPETRAAAVRFCGLYLYDSPNGFSLCFGQLDGAEDMDEDLVVTLPDGTTGTIHYHCSDHKIGKIGKPSSLNRYWLFNGTKVDSSVFTFTVSK